MKKDEPIMRAISIANLPAGDKSFSRRPTTPAVSRSSLSARISNPMLTDFSHQPAFLIPVLNLITGIYLLCSSMIEDGSDPASFDTDLQLLEGASGTVPSMNPGEHSSHRGLFNGLKSHGKSRLCKRGLEVVTIAGWPIKTDHWPSVREDYIQHLCYLGGPHLET